MNYGLIAALWFTVLFWVFVALAFYDVRIAQDAGVISGMFS